MTSTGALVWSGLAVFDLAIALLMLGVRPRRLVNTLMGVVFLSNCLASAAFAASEGGLLAPRAGLWWNFLVAAPGYNALLAVPLVFPRRRLSERGERSLFVLLAGMVVATWGSMALAPDAFLPTPLADGRPYHPPLFVVLRSLGYVAILGGALLFLDGYLTSRTPLQREQSAFFLAAFGLKVTILLKFGEQPFLDPNPTIRDHLMPLFWVVGLAVAAGIASARLRALHRGEGLRDRAWHLDGLVLGTLALGAAIGIRGWPGAWIVELARGVLFSYGVLKFQVLEVDVRDRPLLLATTVIVGTGLAYIIAQDLLQSAGVLASVAGGMALMAALGLGAAMAWGILGRFQLLSTPGGGATMGLPARQAYLAALEAAAADDSEHASSNQRILATLRGRLGVSERDHALMEAEVRGALGSGGPPEVGAAFLGRYRIERLLGTGGFGRAYLATDETVRRRVVLKVGKGEAAEAKRVLREARVLGRLGHPNIVGLFDVERVGDDLLLVLEYVPGGSLADRLARGPLPPYEALRVADDVLAALEAAHREGIVHRDLKPANILLTPEGRAKLADFGIARAPEATLGTLGSTAEGATPGTLTYMSPEQAQGRPVDARSDLYGVGVVLYECLAGRPYLDLRGRTEYEVRRAIAEEPPRLPLPDVPREWNDFLARALAKNPAQRPGNAAEMRRDLARLASPTTDRSPLAAAAGEGPRRMTTA